MNRTQLVFLRMLWYSLDNKNKTCLIFVPNIKKIMELYDCIPEEFFSVITINKSNKTVHFKNGSRVMIKMPSTAPEHIRGFEIDVFEEFGLVSAKTYRELKLRSKPSQ